MAKQTSEALYEQRFPKSKALFDRAQGLLPRGVTHDAWFMRPFPIYIDHSKGPHKWDADGNQYVDYTGGHGALILGHGHPSIVEAGFSELYARVLEGERFEQLGMSFPGTTGGPGALVDAKRLKTSI